MYIVDRIEEGIAVICHNDNGFINVNKSEIRGNVKEGSVVVNENGVWTVDDKETEKRMTTARTRLDKLFNKK